MPALPRAAWLAAGAIAAALLTSGGPSAASLPPLATTLVSAAAIATTVVALRRGRVTVAALAFGFGAVASRTALALLMGSAAATALPLPAGDGGWDGRVVDVSAPSGTQQRAFVHLGDPAGEAGWLVYAWLPRHPTLLPGDHVSLRGRLEPPPDDAPGFAGFLAGHGAVGTLEARSFELLAPGSGVMAAVEQLRWGMDGALARAVPEPEAGLAAGILVGLRERVSRSVADDFTVTGLTHVVAISGWNIALVAGIATGLLRGTGMGRRPRSLTVMAAIVGYTVLAGAEASVIRAAVMGGVVLLAREGGRPSGAAAALGVACWGLLLVEPRMVGDIGLQLSLAATAGLLALGGHAEAVVRRLAPGWAPRWFCETLGVSLAAQLATLPLILLHFGRLSLISPLANLLVAPVVPLAMLAAVVGVIIGPLLVAPAASVVLAPLSLLAWLPLAAMVRGAALLADVPFASVELPAFSGLAGAGISLGALLLALRAARARPAVAAPLASWETPSAARPSTRPARRLRSLAALGTSAILVAALSAILAARPAGQLHVSVLDVGQGDAILLEASAGERVLVDGGPDPDLLVRRLDERIPVWDRRIDLVVLTHPHEDHSGGLAGLAPRYSVGRIAETGMASQGAGVREMRASAARLGVGRVRLVQGDAFPLGKARVEVLWPPRDLLPEIVPESGRAINDTSIVLGIGIGRQRVLLSGDLEEDRDPDLLKVIGDDGRRWDLLKVAHHGSATATSRPLLEALRPRLAAISVGEGNDYGHPAPETLQRLAEVGAVVWRTDRQGTLSVALDGRSTASAALPDVAPRSEPCPAGTAPTPLQQATDHGACYARSDGGPHPNRSALIAHVHGALASSPAARHGGGRGGRLPGVPGRAVRPRRGPAPGGDSRAPPRRRQGAAPRASQPGARTWPRRCRLAQPGRTPGAVAVRLGTSGDASR